MRILKSHFVMFVLISVFVLTVFLNSCTDKNGPDSGNTVTCIDGDGNTIEYAEQSTDSISISEYTGIVFPEDSELLEAYTPKSSDNEKDYSNLFDLFEDGVYAKVSVEKDQINEFYSRISEDCKVIEENSSEQFFTAGPFSVGEIPSGELCRYYVIVYSPEIDGMDEYMHEYMRILTCTYVYDCGDTYNVFLGSYKTYIR